MQDFKISRPPDSMDLYFCLPLLAVLLQPTLCLYNCSSEYERTPGRLISLLNLDGINIFKSLLFNHAFLFSLSRNIKAETLTILCLFCLTLKENSDMTVDCGTTMITLEINLCTAQWAGFNTTDLALNGNHNITDCLGSVDSSVDPPVIRYQLPVNHSEDNPCRQSLQVRWSLV